MTAKRTHKRDACHRSYPPGVRTGWGAEGGGGAAFEVLPWLNQRKVWPVPANWSLLKARSTVQSGSTTISMGELSASDGVTSEITSVFTAIGFENVLPPSKDWLKRKIWVSIQTASISPAAPVATTGLVSVPAPSGIGCENVAPPSIERLKKKPAPPCGSQTTLMLPAASTATFGRTPCTGETSLGLENLEPPSVERLNMTPPTLSSHTRVMLPRESSWILHSFW